MNVFNALKKLFGLLKRNRLVLRVFVIFAILVLAYFLQHWSGLGRVLLNNTRSELLQNGFWLVLVVVVLLWIAWDLRWLVKLLSQKEDHVEFRDIYNAWTAAAEKLRAFRLESRPLYLMLGCPAGGEEAFFQASLFEWQLRGVPNGPAEPIHLWATNGAMASPGGAAQPNQPRGANGAVILTCAGASQLGSLAAVIVKETVMSVVREEESSLRSASEAVNIGGTIRGAEGLGQPGKLPGSGESRGTISGSSSEEEPSPFGPSGSGIQNTITGSALRAFGNVMRTIRQAGRSAAKVPRYGDGALRAFVNNIAERDRQTARLKYLCRLITQSAKPSPPLRGVLLLVPAVILDERADHAASVCRQDLNAVRSATQLDFVTVVVVSDMEKLPGFSQFYDRFPRDQRNGRLGQNLPIAPDLEYMGASYGSLLDKLAAQVCESVIPSWVYRMLRVDTSAPTPTEKNMNDNAQLFRFFYHTQTRSRGLGRVLQRIFTKVEGQPWCGGCYVVGSGSEHRDQLFVRGSLGKLLTGEFENCVSWHQRAIDLDSKRKKLTVVGYMAIAAMFTIVVLGISIHYFATREDDGGPAEQERTAAAEKR